MTNVELDFPVLAAVRNSVKRVLRPLAIITQLVLLSELPGVAQSNVAPSTITTSNNVYSRLTTPFTSPLPFLRTPSSPPLYGWQVSALHPTKFLTFGSPPHKFFIHERNYWTDSTGRTILFGPNIQRRPGDIKHWIATIGMGSYAINLPLPLLVIAVLAGCFVLALGYVSFTSIMRFVRGNPRVNDEPAKT